MKYVLYVLLIMGLLLVFQAHIAELIKPIFVWIKKRKLPFFSTIEKQICLRLQILRPQWRAHKVGTMCMFFLIGSGCLFLTCFCLLYGQGYGVSSVAVGMLMGALPFCYMQFAVTNQQISGSYEGQVLLTELLNQYKLNHMNGLAAIEKSLPFLEKAPISQGLLYPVVLQLKMYRTNDELQSILNNFADRCNTNWARMLATNMYYAISADANVTLGLTDLLKECTYTQKLIEQSKRQNNEAFVMIQLLCPAVYIVLIWSLVVHFDFTIRDIVHYQLFTPTGALLFILMVMGGTLGLLLARVLSHPKFDV